MSHRLFRWSPLRLFLFTFLTLWFAASSPAVAGWEVDGGFICYFRGSQHSPVMIPDGAGGAIVAWIDSRDGPELDIYAQRVDGNGRALWAFGGMPVCAASGDQEGIAMVSDGAGGAYVAWVDSRGDDSDIVLQRLDSNGDPLFVVGGLPVATADFDQSQVAMVADGAGGVILAWADARNFPDDLSLDIYAQRVNAGGAMQWASNGVAVVSHAGAQRAPTLIADGSGGAFFAWEDTRYDTFENDLSYDVFASHINATGGEAWTSLVLSAIYSQTNVQLVPRAGGGGLLFWRDSRQLGTLDVYGSSFSASGAVLHPTDTGKGIATGAESDLLTAVVPDGSGGAVVLWSDDTGDAYDLRALRLDAALNPVWAPGGVVVCDAEGSQTGARATADGEGGIFVTWVDTRTGGGEDIYAQHVDASGVSIWNANGRVVCADSFRQLMPAVCADGAGGALFAWHDQRLGTPGDIFGHRVNAAGTRVPLWFIWESACWNGSAVELNWRVTGGADDIPWSLVRVDASTSVQESVDAPIQAIGNGRFQVLDETIRYGSNYTYFVRVVSPDGNVAVFDTDSIFVPVPNQSFAAPDPNPFRSRTQLAVFVGSDESVRLNVYDLAGRRVARIMEGALPAGRHVFEWDGRDERGDRVAAATYILRFDSARGVATRKVLVLR